MKSKSDRRGWGAHEYCSSIDWTFLELLLGEIFGAYGKLIFTACSLLITIVTVIGFIIQHRRASMLERILGRNAADLRKDQKFLEKGKAALEQAAAAAQGPGRRNPSA